MPWRASPSRAVLAAWAALALVVLVVLAAIFDLGPFSDGPQGFLARGDEICKSAHDRFADQQQSPPRTAREAAELTANLVTIAREELDQIRKLQAPDSIAEPLARYLTARERGIAGLQRGADAARAANVDSYRRFQARLAAGQLDRRRLARKVGFEECSRPSLSGAELATQSEVPPSSNPSAPAKVNNPPPAN